MKKVDDYTFYGLVMEVVRKHPCIKSIEKRLLSQQFHKARNTPRDKYCYLQLLLRYNNDYII